MMTAHNTAPRPICPCQRNVASPVAEAAAGPTAAGENRPFRRTGGAAAFALPSVALALVPKCPMCIAAWLAIGGGFGISISTAAHLRTAMVWLCWSVLVLLAARVAMRFRTKSKFRSGYKPAVMSSSESRLRTHSGMAARQPL
jgi:hypothetical protein